MEVAETLTKHRDRIYAAIDGDISLAPENNTIMGSWVRCLNQYGLDPDDAPQPLLVDAETLKEIRNKSTDFIKFSITEMEYLYKQIKDSGLSIQLTNDSGVILDCMGDANYNKLTKKRDLSAGVVWAEEYQGTNAIGTCLVEQYPVTVNREEHFLSRNLSLTCSAVPIQSINNRTIGVICISGESCKVQRHTMALVDMSVKSIENRIFLHSYTNKFVMRFHRIPEFINTHNEGLIAFNSDGTILDVNRCALHMIGYSEFDELSDYKIDEVTGYPISELLEKFARAAPRAIPLHECQHMREFFASVLFPEATSLAVYYKDENDNIPAINAVTQNHISEMDNLEFGDSNMAKNIRIAKRVMNRDIPILLNGESGTGKGIFARAIHRLSKRADKPFVAINSASIPETLIESELFGYKGGAFTGASRHGNPGKILQADGGTLFLDEIGDMPLLLQARLLRVLEEKEVVPLGGHKPVSVDLRIISATHRNLLDMVAEGSFREDLYYRLQGVALNLPPLRERADRDNLIKYLIKLERVGAQRLVKFEDDILKRLNIYSWPGNIRQLRNVLRTVIALSESNHIILDDFIEELLHVEGITEEKQKEGQTDHDPLRSAERTVLLSELEKHHWNITNTAHALKMSRNTLYRKMKHCNIPYK